MHKQIYSHIKRVVGSTSLSVLLLIILFISCLIGLYALVDMVFEDNSYVFDKAVFAGIAPWYNSFNTSLMQGITFFGSQYFLLPANILLILIVFFKEKNKWNWIKVAAIGISSTAVMFLLKLILQRQRPEVPLIVKAHGYSFPSGHTFTSLCFFGMLIYIVYKKIQQPFIKWLLIALMIMLVLLIGFSRIYLKLHYASDVIAGLCLGTIWLLLAKWLLFKTEKKIESTHVTSKL
ncbi:MAG: phosphatase PAP2 family protein [Ferruginibacter sp.]